MGVFDTLVSQLSQVSAAEGLAVVLAVAYLLLAIRQNILCWVCAFVSTAIYVYVFHNVALLMESALNVFYMAMAVYGFWSWRNGGAEGESLAVTLMPWRTHALALAAILLLSFASSSVLLAHTAAAMPFLDSLTTWSAVWATWLIARKELRNWFYWAAIDAVSIYLYLSRELVMTAGLFVVYLILIPVGYLTWRRSYEHNRP